MNFKKQLKDGFLTNNPVLVQLLGKDRIYALEDPGYSKVGLICRAAGARTVPIALDNSGLDIRALEASGAGVAHISPAHHFPTGIVMPISRRRELLRWAREQDGILIEDDHADAKAEVLEVLAYAEEVT